MMQSNLTKALGSSTRTKILNAYSSHAEDGNFVSCIKHIDLKSDRAFRQSLLQVALENFVSGPDVNQRNIWSTGSSIIFISRLLMLKTIPILWHKFSQFSISDTENADLKLVDEFKRKRFFQRSYIKVIKAKKETRELSSKTFFVLLC